MVILGLLIVPLSLASEPNPVAATELPVRSLTMYRGQVAWIERAGSVPVKDGTALLELDTDALADTVAFDTPRGGPAPAKIDLDPTGPLVGFVDPAWAHHAPNGLEVAVFLTDAPDAPPRTGHAWRLGSLSTDTARLAPAEHPSRNRMVLLVENGVTTLGVDDIRQVVSRRRRIPAARLSFPPETQSAEIEISALVWGLAWSPQYRLTLFPDNQASVRLSATARNFGSKAVATERAVCSCRNPLLNRNPDEAPPHSGLGQEYPIGALTLSPGQAVTRTLVETTRAIRKIHVWNVGGVAFEHQPPPPKDELTAFLEVEHPDHPGLPAGPVTVTEAGRLLAVTRWPEPGDESRSLVPLGASDDLAIEREEVELERKRGGAVEEDAPADWVVMTGSLSLRNRTPQAARVRIVKTFLGEGTVASDEGQIQRRPNHLGQRHAVGEIQWEIDVPGGQTKRLTYGYQMAIPNR